MEDSGWELWGYGSDDARIWHVCPADETCDRYFVYSVNPHCSRCNDTPPDALVGLHALYKWER